MHFTGLQAKKGHTLAGLPSASKDLRLVSSDLRKASALRLGSIFLMLLPAWARARLRWLRACLERLSCTVHSYHSMRLKMYLFWPWIERTRALMHWGVRSQARPLPLLMIEKLHISQV